MIDFSIKESIQQDFNVPVPTIEDLIEIWAELGKDVPRWILEAKKAVQ